jgi:putative membrane protein
MPWGAAGGGLLPTLLWLLVLLAVLAGLAYLVLRLADGRSTDGRSVDGIDPVETDPVGVLETRYARGEIDDEEFERRRDRLAGGT